MTPDEIACLFTRPDGQYRFARWGRPVVPVVFGVEDATLATLKGAIEAVVTLAGHKMAEVDPELGVNLMLFFCRDWDELPDVPKLDLLIPDLAALTARLKAVEAAQYRLFRYDEAGAIRACFSFLRLDARLREMPAEVLALDLAARAILDWSEAAFAGRSPLAAAGGRTILRPEIGDVIRAAYDPAMPVAAADAGHALRLAARLSRMQGP